MKDHILPIEAGISLSEDDVIAAMRETAGYIDLTPHDFRLLYEKAYVVARKRLLQETPASSVMRAPAITVRSDASVEDLVQLLADKGISGAPVVDDGNRLVGVVSEKDILKLMGKAPDAHLMRLIADSLDEPPVLDRHSRQRRIGEIMTTPPVCIRADGSLGAVARLFEEKNVNRLPVVDEANIVTGILTRADVVAAAAQIL